MATYYFRSTGTNWNLTASWSSTSSPTYTNVTTVPGIADDVFFEAASANCTITTVAAAADRIDFTNGGTSNYTGLFTVGTNTNGTLTLSRSLALSPSMSDVTGSANITIQQGTTCAITSSGKSIHRLFYTSGGPSAILNLADTLIIKDFIQTTYSNGAPAVLFNGGDVMLRGTSFLYDITTGSSTIYLNPQANQTASLDASSFGTISNNLIISGSGRVNFTTALNYVNGKITYVTASEVTFTNNHNLSIAVGTTALDTAGMMWNRCDMGGGARALILSSSLNISQSFSYSNNAIGVTSIGGSRINAYGNVNISTANGVNIPITITGSNSGRTITNFTPMVTSCSLEFKLSGGSITVSSFAVAAGSQVEIINNSTGGTIIASGSTITLNTNATPRFNTNTILWGNLTSAAGNTVTLLSPFLISSSLTFGAGGNLTFTGSAGWTCGNLICSTAGRTLTLANSSSGASYRTTNNAALTGGTAASRITMTSDNASTQSIWTLDNGAIQSLVYVNGTRIDSSQGQTIWSFGGTLNGTTNWGTGSQPLTQANTFVC